MQYQNKYLKDKDIFVGQYRRNWPHFIEQIRVYAINNQVPIIEDDALNFLYELLNDKTFNNILEIGTAIGYSALIFRHLFPDAKITTVERNPNFFNIAKNNIEKNSGNIELIFGDAAEYLKNRKEKIDFLFIDAAKGQYLNFFKLAKPLLNEGALIISDNIFARGLTFNPDIIHRHKTIQNRMNEFVEFMVDNYDSTLINISDGLLITRYYE